MRKLAYLLLIFGAAFISGCGEDEDPLCETNNLGHILFKNPDNGFNTDSIYVHLGSSNLGVVRSLGELLVNNLPAGTNLFTFTFRGDTLYQENLVVTKCETDEYDIDWNPVSDKRLKKDIQPMKSMLAPVLKLNTYTYQYNLDDFTNYALPGGTHYGFMAQDLQKDFPEVVVNFRDGFSAVNYYEMIPVLTKAMQEQQVQIDDLKKEVETLKQLVAQHQTVMK